MRILIINYFYPPIVDAHAYRWEQIARHWVAQGHRVDVICGRLRGIPDRSVQSGVHVTRVGLAGPVMNSAQSGLRPTEMLARVRRFIVNALRPYYRKLYWPDAFWHWWPSAVFETLTRRHLDYELVISYYPCLGAHFAASALKRWSKSSNLRWIADYGDPFSTSVTMPPNNFARYRRLNDHAERRIARRADALVFTNENTASAFREKNVCSRGKVRVIPHLVDVQRVYAGARSDLASSDHGAASRHVTRLLYVGGFHRGIREPDLLFDIVRRLNRDTQHEYLLTIYGPTNGFDLTPRDCPHIHYEGMIERGKALDLIREADVLVNVDNMNCVMVPSKIVEYIGTGRPVLNLQGGGARHAALLKYAEQGFALEVSRNDLPADDAGPVARFLERMAGAVAPLDTVENVLEGYTLSGVAEQYRALARPLQQQAADA